MKTRTMRREEEKRGRERERERKGGRERERKGGNGKRGGKDQNPRQRVIVDARRKKDEKNSLFQTLASSNRKEATAKDRAAMDMGKREERGERVTNEVNDV